MGRHTAIGPGTTTAQRLLAAALVGAFALTVLGLAVLWPRGEAPRPAPGFAASQTVAADAVAGEVSESYPSACSSPVLGGVFTTGSAPRVPAGGECSTAVVLIGEGPDEGRVTLLQTSGQAGEPVLAPGDRVLLGRGAEPATYAFLDMDRGAALWVWLAATAAVIVIAAAWHGVRALAGLALSLALIGVFLVPALLRGGPPVPLAVVTGAAILFPVMFLVHGVNWKSAAALGGTLASLAASAGLARAAISTADLRGLGDDSNLLIQLYLPSVSVAGLMLAGFIIGTLGALNDATVAQASTVAELADANPGARPAELFASAMRVGRDHIASMVYTLVLAYIGAALPMTLLLAAADRPLAQVLTSDIVATELLRSAVGALGLTLAVPVTTLVAALTAARGRG